MITYLYDRISDPHFMGMVLVGIATAAAVMTVALPFVERNALGKRMKAVALERDRIRMREGGRAVRPQPLARHRHSQAEAPNGRLPRRPRRGRVPVLPAGGPRRLPAVRA